MFNNLKNGLWKFGSVDTDITCYTQRSHFELNTIYYFKSRFLTPILLDKKKLSEKLKLSHPIPLSIFEMFVKIIEK
jgi:hypothetical protein